MKVLLIRIEVWGPNACFTRPEFKTERVSYDIMTPSAARGIIEAVYWHPGLKYHIDKIYLLNPVQFANIRRNEINSVVSASTALSSLKTGKPLASYAGENRLQRASMILKDVHYIIEEHIEMTEKAAPSDNLRKFEEILQRRLKRGQCYSQPYFGCREFAAHFSPWEEESVPALPLTQDFGFMLYDMDFSNPENIKPQFFRAKMVDGVLDVSNCEVLT